MQLTLKEEVHITTHTLEKEELRQVPVKVETIVVERREGVDGAWVEDDSPNI
jgi:stress response protein YsnF